MKLTINLLILAGAVGVYAALPKNETPLARLFNQVPALKSERNKLVQGTAQEVLKIAGIYVLLNLFIGK